MRRDEQRGQGEVREGTGRLQVCEVDEWTGEEGDKESQREGRSQERGRERRKKERGKEEE